MFKIKCGRIKRPHEDLNLGFNLVAFLSEVSSQESSPQGYVLSRLNYEGRKTPNGPRGNRTPIGCSLRSKEGRVYELCSYSGGSQINHYPMDPVNLTEIPHF